MLQERFKCDRCKQISAYDAHPMTPWRLPKKCNICKKPARDDGEPGFYRICQVRACTNYVTHLVGEAEKAVCYPHFLDGESIHR